MVLDEMFLDEKVSKLKKLEFPLAMYATEGHYYLRLSQFHSALACFETGLKKYPGSVQCQVGKAKCLVRLGQYEEAVSCADAAVKFDPQSPDAGCVKGEAEYFRGNIERGFATFFAGSRSRPNHGGLQSGKQLCRDLLDGYSPRALCKVRVDDVRELDQKMTAAIPPASMWTRRSQKGYVDILRRNYTCKSDLKFVTALLVEDAEDSASPAVRDLWSYLEQQRRVWKGHHPRKARRTAKSTEAKIEEAAMRLHESEEACKRGDAIGCILHGFEALDVLESLPSHNTRVLRIKERAYHLIGLSYVIRGDLESAVEYLTRALKVAEELKEPRMTLRCNRAIGEVLLKSRRIVEARQAFWRCLPVAGDREGDIWYKIAECHMKEGAFGEARKAAEVGWQAAEHLFRIDLTVLLAEIAVRELRMIDARALYEEAVRIAVKNHDPRAQKVKNLLERFDKENPTLSEKSEESTETTNDIQPSKS